MEIDRNGLEVLNRTECLRLLGTMTLGRVGFTAGSVPRILPVNFRLVDDRILIRTGPGSKLDAATRNAVVAFEIDDVGPAGGSGWSVLVTGVARGLTDGAIDEADRVRLARYAPRGEGRVVVITIGLISGRRIVPGQTVARALPGVLLQEHENLAP